MTAVKGVRRAATDLADRVRTALAGVPNVEEKKMFGGIAFMVGGKLCISAGRGRIMCRIDPATHERAIRAKGCRTMTMKGRQYIGYVYVDETALKTKRDLQRWVDAALDYNRVVAGS